MGKLTGVLVRYPEGVAVEGDALAPALGGGGVHAQEEGGVGREAAGEEAGAARGDVHQELTENGNKIWHETQFDLIEIHVFLTWCSGWVNTSMWNSCLSPELKPSLQSTCRLSWVWLVREQLRGASGGPGRGGKRQRDYMLWRGATTEEAFNHLVFWLVGR